MTEIFDFNILAASNNLPPPDGWPEFMEYEEVNDAARELMAKLARYHAGAFGGAKLTATSTTAYTLVSGFTFAAYVAGQMFAFRAHASSTGNVTLNVDGKGAAAVLDSTGRQLTTNDLLANGIYHVVYTAAGSFRVIGHLTSQALQAQALNTLGQSYLTTGTQPAYVVTTGLFTAYADGQMIAFRAHASNAGGAATINIDGLGTNALVDYQGVALAVNDIIAGRAYIASRSGGQFRILTSLDIDLTANVVGTLPLANGGTGQTTAANAATALFMQTYIGGTVGGTGNAITLTAVNFALATQAIITFTPTTVNSGATTLAINATAPQNLFKLTGSGAVALSGGELQVNIPVVVRWDGSNYFLVSPTSTMYAQPQATGLTVRNNAGTPNTQVDFAASSVTLMNATGQSYTPPGGVGGTINAATTGANALDTGALAANTWYYVWLISSGNFVAGLLSLSATAPTMPATYTHKIRVGAMKTGAASTFLRTSQKGNRAQYEVIAGSTTPNLPIIGSGASGSPTVPTWTSVGVSAGTVPATATRVQGFMASQSSGVRFMCAPNNAYGAYNSATNPPPVGAISGNTQPALNIPYEFALESTNIFWASDAAAVQLVLMGWTDAVNCS